jgi:hypothetical protein
MAMAFSAAPASAAREQAHACVVPKVTPQSYTWDFKGEANRIFKDIQDEANDALYRSDQLQTFTMNDGPWGGDSDLLNRVKEDVNSIENKLCRLETIRRVVDPEQQRTIEKIGVSAQLMANSLVSAYQFGDAHPEALWSPAFRRSLDNLRTEASRLTHSVDSAVQYAKGQKERRKMGALRTSS